MPEWKRRLLGLGLPCLLAFAFDIGLTMYNQPAEYWAGDYSRTTEAHRSNASCTKSIPWQQ